MQAARLLARLQREITMLKTDPPPGVCAWPHNDLLTHLEARKPLMFTCCVFYENSFVQPETNLAMPSALFVCTGE